MNTGIRILHVDDDPDMVDLTAAYLNNENDKFFVETATAASEGLEQLAREEFDCVVSDYEMPKQDGIEFLESVRDLCPDLPFILFTGRGSEEIASEAITAGVTDYLQKDAGTEQFTILANRIRNAVERTRAERERQRHLDAIETAQEGISILDEDGVFVYVNEAYADLYGYKPAQLIGEHWSLTYPEDAVDAAFEKIVPQVEADGSWHGETIGLRADGSTFIEDHTIATTDDGELVCSVRDITDKKERERWLQAVFDNTDIFTGLVDPDGAILEVNEAALTFANLNREEVVGQPLWETGWFDYSADVQQKVREAVEEARNGAIAECEIVFPSRDGEVVVDLTIRPVFDDQGEVSLLVPEGHDITEQRQYVRQLETLIDNLPGIVYQCRNERGWPMEKVSGQVVELTGYQPSVLEDNDGFYGSHIVHPDDQEVIWETVQEAVSEEEPFELVYRITTKDGTIRWVWERGQGVYSSEGSLEALEGFITDITEQKEATKNLEQQNEQLHEFTRVISHDLRNPLQVVSGRVTLLQEEFESENLEIISTTLDRMERILDDMLWLTKEGRSIGETSRVNLRQTIEDAWEIVGAEADEAQLIFETESQDNAWEFNADYDRLRQALENILRNALEHAGNDVCIRVEVFENGFVIEDDGPGIQIADKERIFESGYSTSDGGTGFGLQIVEQIVQAHGWKIQITDVNGGGARFKITGTKTEETNPTTA